MISPKAAVVHTRKALEFVNEMNRRSTTLYTSTQDQIKEMISNCYDLIEIGQSMLDDPCRIVRGGDVSNIVKQQPDSPFVKRDEFNQLLSSVKVVAQNLAVMSDVVKTAVVNRSSDSNVEVDSKDDEDNNRPSGGCRSENVHTDEQSLSNNNPSKSVEANIKASCKGYIEVHKISDAIDKVVQAKEYSDVCHYTTLSRVIHDWFKYRIKLLDKTKSPFRYHASNIMEYIRAIVSSYCSSEDKSSWLSNFSSWIKKLIANDPSVTSYALPYDVFQKYKSNKGLISNMSMNGLGRLMWSMLSECGLSKCINGHLVSGDIKYMGQVKTCREIFELSERGVISLC